MQRENIKAMSVKKDAVDDFMEFVAVRNFGEALVYPELTIAPLQSYFPRTVYSEKCRSWYKKGAELGPVVALWPGQYR